MEMVAAPTTCPSCGAPVETGPFCRMCGVELYRERPAGLAQIEQVVSWAGGAVARERLAVQETRIERPCVTPDG